MTGLYVDTSALLKRVFVEAESPVVREILRGRVSDGDLVAASELAWVEAARAFLGAGVKDTDSAISAATTGIARHPLTSDVLSRARTIGPASLRSLDAIHLSAAISLGCVELLTFDRRLAEGAGPLGLRILP